MPAVPPGEQPERPPSPTELCPASLDGSAEKQCCLPRGHAGLHRWRSPDSAQAFAWG